MTNQNLDQALTLVPVVERVHGKNHPESVHVRELVEKFGADGHDAATWQEVRTVTKNYAVPDDACEGFTGYYAALRRADTEVGRSSLALAPEFDGGGEFDGAGYGAVVVVGGAEGCVDPCPCVVAAVVVGET